MIWLIPFGIVIVFTAVVVGMLMKLSLTFPKSRPATKADLERFMEDVG